MSLVFWPSLANSCLFFNDILVYSPKLDTHETHQRVVFNIPQGNLLYTNLKQGHFTKEQIKHLGHWVPIEVWKEEA